MKFKKPIYLLALPLLAGVLLGQRVNAQQPVYIAPQDTVKTLRMPNTSLNAYQQRSDIASLDSRMLGAAVYAANVLADTAAYDAKQGVPLAHLFKAEDLAYFSKRGLPTVVALFEQVNKNLPKGRKIEFISDSLQTVTTVRNPLALQDLKAKISSSQADLTTDPGQWQENVYQAYIARDYGTKLNNTITITSATRELRELPELQLLDAKGAVLSLGQLMARERKPGRTVAQVEAAAVVTMRKLTFPNAEISKEIANENYRRTLLALIALQEADFKRHEATAQLIGRMTQDLGNAENSRILKAIKGSTLFDENVPGNLGPVMLTESNVLDGAQLAARSASKAKELITLTALHYGERDAVKLYTRLLNGQGALAASATGEFSAKRLSELRYHGVEKLRSVGLGPDKTEGISMADLVLLAVAAPELPVNTDPMVALTLVSAGERIVMAYTTKVTEEYRKAFMLSPRISLGSRHTEYTASYDAVNFANGSKITQNGLELRLETDLYFSDLEKMMEKRVKPFIYPEFGILMGSGTRKVGYGPQRYLGPHGAVPQFKQNYINWGGHLGLNVGPVLVGVDATVLSTKSASDPYRRFFDLSQAMTYYRYSFLTRVLNLGISKADSEKPLFLSLDLEMAGETNNEGTRDRTRTQDGGAQIKSTEWARDYAKARPNGKYNQAIATQMIMDGEVKAAYPSANYAAVHLGIAREALQLKMTAGLYNLTAIDGYSRGKGEWINRLLKHTLNGNAFAAATLTYNFGASGSSSKRRKTQHSSTLNGQTTMAPEESAYERKKLPSGLRNRAIFMNRKGG